MLFFFIYFFFSSTQGSHIFHKLRPVDQMRHLLVNCVGGESEEVERFFKLHKVQKSWNSPPGITSLSLKSQFRSPFLWSPFRKKTSEDSSYWEPSPCSTLPPSHREHSWYLQITHMVNKLFLSQLLHFHSLAHCPVSFVIHTLICVFNYCIVSLFLILVTFLGAASV